MQEQLAQARATTPRSTRQGIRAKYSELFQRRLKLWRSEQASALLLGSGEIAAQTDVIVTSPEKPQLLDGAAVV
ncbi:hypothetical protein ACVW1C_005997 [Bradyrhizobium sp. USDA 4011]